VPPLVVVSLVVPPLVVPPLVVVSLVVPPLVVPPLVVVSLSSGRGGTLNCAKAFSIILPPSPRLAGNNNRMPKITATTDVLHLSLKIANGLVIIRTILESFILIWIYYSDAIH
jgi:hypothetical protein